jgi:tRNA-2-methylthio-N6-dimethylallyladenosine synthase
VILLLVILEKQEKDFEETLDLIQKIGFVNSYSFIFSPRPGTPAAEKKLNNLSKSKKRLIKLQDILEKLQLENNKNYLKQYCEVLIENKLNNQEKILWKNKYMTPVIFDSNNCIW